MRKILEDFYFGNITPSVRIMTPNSKLRRMVNNVTRCENQLKEQLNETEQALLTELVSSQQEIDRIGGYKLAPMEPCNLPEQVATGFAQVTEHWCGAGYTPVLYVGSQVVHGVNHMLICKQQIIVPDAPEHLVTMVLNQNCDGGDIVGKWSIVSIEKIV